MNKRWWLVFTAVLSVIFGACAADDPVVSPSPSAPAGASLSPGGPASPSDPLLLGQGSTGTGIDYTFNLVPGDPLCVQLRQTNGQGDFMTCDEDSEQNFNGDERLRYAFGGLNAEQTPKFVIGITADDIDRVVVNLPDTESPSVKTATSTRAPGRRFFVVMLNPDPPQEIQAVRGLDAAGKTVAGFSLGVPGESSPSPLPTG